MFITHDAQLLLLAGLAVVGGIVLVTWCKLPAYIALILASLWVGLCSGKSPSSLTMSFAEGVGSVLGSTAMILGLGAILGKALDVSGGARQLGNTLIRSFPNRWTSFAIACAAFLIGIPVFFSAGLVLLIPVVSTAAQERRIALSRLGLPMVVGLSVAHGLVPPHPGPISAVGIIHADLARTIFYSLAIGLPTSLVTGAIFAPMLTRSQIVEPSEMAAQSSCAESGKADAGLGIALAIILAPIALMGSAAAADFCLPDTSMFRRGVEWLGNPLVAMLLGALLSLWSLASHHGFDRRQLASLCEECLAPIASVLLVVGAGGGFSKVLIDSGVGIAVARQATASNISPLLLGWLLSAFIRIATGSATVAITTAAGLLAPIAAAAPALHRELLIVAMGAGSLVLSHVNDGGFWLVKQYLNLTLTETLKTWTLLESAISFVALSLVLLLNLVL
jgi:GntP family gluconate:H+ symporter